MGRRKLNMELISKQRSRMLTFKKRKDGLMKKLHELTTLCDVSACMIIYGPVQENRAVEPEIWPQNPVEVRRMIHVYKAKSKDSGSYKSFGLCDFFDQRKKKAEEELEKLRKKNVEAKYPIWNELLSGLNEATLRGFAAALNDKVQIVKSRIELLKREKQESDMMKNRSMVMDFAPPYLSQFYTLNQDQFYTQNQDQEIMPIIDHDMGSSMDLQNNFSDNCASFERKVFYDQATAAGNGLGYPMISYDNHTMPMEQINYAPPLLPPPPPQPYMHWPMVNLNYHAGGEDDITRYLLQFN